MTCAPRAGKGAHIARALRYEVETHARLAGVGSKELASALLRCALLGQLGVRALRRDPESAKRYRQRTAEVIAVAECLRDH